MVQILREEQEQSIDDDRRRRDDELTRRDILRTYESLLADTRYPAPWIRANMNALISGDYSPLAKLFCEMTFIGPQGHFAIAGPYTVLRGARSDQKLSGVVGRALPAADLPPLESEVSNLIGPLRQAIPRLIPVEVSKSWGNLEGERGEAFIVPSAWAWPIREAQVGPAINNMSEQRRRWEKAGFACVSRIFDSQSADLLLSAVMDRSVAMVIQNREYQLHDCGHAAGLGLDYKLEKGLLPNPWMQGIEEWRADGIDFELAFRVLPLDEAYCVVASNFVTRFGLDAHRIGGYDRDYDTVVVVLLLDRLLKSGAIVLSDGRLSIKDPTPRGLLRSVELHRVEAVQLTREELALQYDSALGRLYSKISASPAAEEIFNSFVVEPCRGLYSELR